MAGERADMATLRGRAAAPQRGAARLLEEGQGGHSRLNGEQLAHHLRQLLEQQLAMAADSLNWQHRQAVRAVERFCTDSGTASAQAGGPVARVATEPAGALTSKWAWSNEHPFPVETLPGECSPRKQPCEFEPIATPVTNMMGHVPFVEKDETVMKTGSTASAKKQVQNLKNRKEFKRGKTQVDNERKAVVGKPVFADADAMKDQVRKAIHKPEYNVAKYYRPTGWAQAVATSALFDNLTLVVIGLNTIWIAVDTEFNKASTLFDADLIFQIVENMFCVYFTGEVIVRYLAFASKWNCRKDAWFVFDGCLVIMMVLETWILNFCLYFLDLENSGLRNASGLRALRMLRLTRMARMVRLLRALPELMILLKGMSVATRSVFFTLCLLGIVVYIFAIAFMQMTDGALKRQYFSTLPNAMSTLLLRATLPDMAEVVEDVGKDSFWLACLMLVFILLSSLTVLNMLVGVLCEVVSVVSSVEKERMTVRFMKVKLLELINREGIDANCNQNISRDEFMDLLLHPQGIRVIQEVGVDVVGLVDFVDHIFEDNTTEISFADFVELILQLRSSNVATVKDIVDFRKYVSRLLEVMQEDMHDRVIDQVESRVKRMLNETVGGIMNGLEVDDIKEVV
eukprot:TRINITY_DN2441_c0_g2_i3.p1 TRINITY_DN2441_c0_g2~~TRINITY_DN2441_c0_g2_i3.p1  ORF type:complete len:688 (-),score=152.33 TRINITY_DN2441_c0_g2_i3:34-1914(-)